MRKVVIPGEELGELKPGTRLPFGLFREGNKVFSSVYGLYDEEKGQRVTPLNGGYIPRPGDLVIGIVLMEKFSGYLVEINSPYLGFLHAQRSGSGSGSGRERRIKPGDIITAKIQSTNEVGDVALESPRRLITGKMVEVKPTKIPRIFGKSGSMLDLIKKETNVQIIVGKNGRIWLKGDRKNILRAEHAIRFIEKNAHMYGLTDKVRGLLEANLETNDESKINVSG